jgi:hypothetical protein
MLTAILIYCAATAAILLGVGFYAEWQELHPKASGQRQGEGCQNK